MSELDDKRLELIPCPECEGCGMVESGSVSAKQRFLDASIAVWEEIDRLSELPDGYKGLDASTELRKTERAAWEQYRSCLEIVAKDLLTKEEGDLVVGAIPLQSLLSPVAAPKEDKEEKGK